MIKSLQFYRRKNIRSSIKEASPISEYMYNTCVPSSMIPNIGESITIDDHAFIVRDVQRHYNHELICVVLEGEEDV